MKTQTFDGLREYVRNECAQDISEHKQYLIESRLRPVMKELGVEDYEALLAVLKRNPSEAVRNSVVDAITTNETLWFRDSSPWTVMEEVILPYFAEQLRSGKKSRIRIWSNACSTGQETYSLIMLMDGLFREGKMKGTRFDQFEIIGTDVSPQAIETANAARYSALEISRGLSGRLVERYFEKDGKEYVFDDLMRRRAQHRVFNLQDNFLPMGRLDLVLCRNVLIYFSDEFKQNVLRRVAMQLNPEGFLLLGSTESALRKSESFSTLSHKGATYYQLNKKV